MATESVEQVPVDDVELQVQVVKRGGVFTSVLYHLSRFWPINLMIRAYRGVWYMFGFRPKCNPELLPTGAVITAPRPSLTVRKRLRRVTRVILAVLPRPVRSAMGYPVSTSIGCSVSPEIRISPTKPSGKGNKRKQDEDEEEDEEDEEEVEQPTWVDALTQELAEDVGSDEDPEYQPSAVETESEEYCSHNNTGDSDADILIPIDDVAVPDEAAATN